MYRDNPNLNQIARDLGYSETYVRKMYKQALKAIIVDDVETHRKIELARLDHLHRKAMEVLEAFHPMVNSGAVVRDVIEDAEGRIIIDEETGKPKTVRLRDQGPLLQAIDRVVKVSERRARLLGLDMPTKTALTDPSGEKESFVQFYIPHNGRDQTEEETTSEE
jgi:AraC-like DNA-binding protein